VFGGDSTSALRLGPRQHCTYLVTFARELIQIAFPTIGILKPLEIRWKPRTQVVDWKEQALLLL